MAEVRRPIIGSLADLAKVAGVSPSTVSRALSGNALISSATRERLVRLAQEHGFQPNQLARNLRLGRTQAIAVVLPLGHETGQHLSDPFFIAMLGYLADALTERGFDLLLSRVIPKDDTWLDAIVDSGRVDGVIVVGQSDQMAVLDRVAARYAPLVVWGAPMSGQRHLCVGSDNRLGGQTAARHLIDTGRRRLAFFGNPEAPEIAERREGFLEACRAGGLEAQCETLPVPLTADAAHAMIARRLERAPAPDGVIAASDVIAMSAIRALSEAGLNVPSDVGVVGYDDVALAAQTTPPLTTIRQDLARGAGLLVDLLFRALAGETVQSAVLKPTLIVRGSTWPLRPAPGRPEPAD